MTDGCAEHLERFNAAAAREYAYPSERFRGRGIVICGGGDKYFPCVWVCINMLRKMGCTLPVELWHFENELTPALKDLLQPLSVRFINATEVRKEHPVRTLHGWELKPYAIIHSAFQEVLLLDADNVAVRDPSFLFDAKPYRETGAIFWPDYARLGEERSAWHVTGVAYRDEPEFESGQIVIDKARCWKALQLTLHLNAWSDFFYGHFHGDKETFHLAWRKIGQDWAMPARGIENIGGYCMAQHDFEGRRLFQHRNFRKWNLTGNPRDYKFWHEEECLEILNILERRVFDWERAAWSSEQEFLFEQVRKQRDYAYVRVGHDRRRIELLEDRQVGLGAAENEKVWAIKSKNGKPVLLLAGDSGVTVEFEPAADGAFAGWWTQFERMPCYLVPIEPHVSRRTICAAAELPPRKNDVRLPLNIGMITLSRQGAYVHETIADLFEATARAVTVDLFPGNLDTAYLDRYRSDPRLTIHPMSSGDWALIEPWGPVRRCSFNFWRAFNYYVNRGEPACLCEDDIIFCHDFPARLAEAVAELETERARYVLALYMTLDLKADRALDRGRYFSAYPSASFFGTQAVYYPAAVLPALEKYFKRVAVEEAAAPPDLVIRDYCTENDLFGTCRPLVQHVGRISSGLGPFHESALFDRNYNPNETR